VLQDAGSVDVMLLSLMFSTVSAVPLVSTGSDVRRLLLMSRCCRRVYDAQLTALPLASGEGDTRLLFHSSSDSSAGGSVAGMAPISWQECASSRVREARPDHAAGSCSVKPLSLTSSVTSSGA
jgi:hypothetical protein